jgi:hypothetical protein
MPDLQSRRQHESEIAAALILVLDSESGVAAAVRGELAAVYAEAMRSVAADRGWQLPDADVDREAEEWAAAYAVTLGREVAKTTRDWIERGGDRESVISAERAENIAITEVTRAITAGELGAIALALALAILDEEPERVWNTEADARVCPVCRPLHRKPETVWRGTAPGGPPAHPRCRCWLEYR